ncbi:MAG: hypothetical protein JWN04_1461 [Myxococcaceae bacterium]|nr:hypothetical protein [Myxococcaceae bacterium]
MKDDCQMVEGKFSADGRVHASFIENYNYLGLSCGGAVCAHNEILVCPLALNPVLFEPLPALSPKDVAWDCAALLDAVDAGKLFPSDMLTFPEDC